jgi:hypothetical protein
MTEINFQNHGLVVKSVLNTYKLYNNLIVRKEEVHLEGNENETGILESAYSTEGVYVGGVEFIQNLPFIQNISEFHSNTLGFSKSELKWYGWGHRAYHSFGIGSQVKVGDIAYTAINLEDLKRWARSFYVDENVLHQASDFNYTCEFLNHTDENENGQKYFLTNYKYTRYTKEGEFILSNDRNVRTDVPDVWGEGEWTAKTLDDAKQMAINFSKGIS